jgi:hypothetical protein
MTHRKILGLIMVLAIVCLLAVECEELPAGPAAPGVSPLPAGPAMEFNLQEDPQQPGPQPTEIIFVKLLDPDHVECVSGLPQETDSVFEPLEWDINLIDPSGVVVRLKIKPDGSQTFVSEEGNEYALDTAVRFSATNRYWMCSEAEAVTVVDTTP